MDDAERLAEVILRLVRRVEAVEGADEDRAREPGVQPSSLLARRQEEAGERLPAHVLHDEQDLVVAHDHVERGHDVRVPDARGEPGLVEEHRDELRVLREVRVEALDGDRAVEAAGAEQPAYVDGRHAAGGDLAEDRVTAGGTGAGRTGVFRAFELVSAFARRVRGHQQGSVSSLVTRRRMSPRGRDPGRWCPCRDLRP